MLRENVDLIITEDAKNVDAELQVAKVIEWLKDSPCRDQDSSMVGDAIGFFVNDKIKCFGKTIDGIHAVVFLGTKNQVSDFEHVGFRKYIFEKAMDIND